VSKRKLKLKGAKPLKQHLTYALRLAKNVPGTRGDTIQSLLRQAILLEGAMDFSPEVVMGDVEVEREADPLAKAQQFIRQVKQRQLEITRMIPQKKEEEP
jgi:hypothetical protein